jgi:hypothetical protein
MAIERKPLPRTIRGGRQFFFDDPAVDKLVSMLLALSGEVWVLRERLAAVEGVAAAKRAFTTEEIEGYEFSPEELQRLGAMRSEFIGNLFRVLEERVDAARTAAASVPGGQAATGTGLTSTGRRKSVRAKSSPAGRKKGERSRKKARAVPSRRKAAKVAKPVPRARKRAGTGR